MPKRKLFWNKECELDWPTDSCENTPVSGDSDAAASHEDVAKGWRQRPLASQRRKNSLGEDLRGHRRGLQDVERQPGGLKGELDPFKDDEFRSSFSLTVETLKIGKERLGKKTSVFGSPIVVLVETIAIHVFLLLFLFFLQQLPDSDIELWEVAWRHLKCFDWFSFNGFSEL